MHIYSNDPEATKLVQQGAQRLGLELERGQTALLLQHLDLLYRWYKLFNLTSIAEEQWISKHLLDSLSAYGFLPRTSDKLKCLDVGSGPGFPGLPLAVASQHEWYLLDKNSKKCGFLLRAKLELELDNLFVINSQLAQLGLISAAAGEESLVLDAEQACSFGAPVPAQFDVIIARSAFSEDELLSRSYPLLKTGGTLLAMHGKYSGQPQQFKQGEQWKLLQFEKVKVPTLNAARHIISWQKIN